MADRERREVIYTNGGGGGGTTAIVAVAALAIIVLLFLVFGRGLLNGGGDTKTIKANVDISGPAKAG